MFAAQLAGGIITFVYKDSFQTGLVDAMTVLMKRYNSDGNARETWDKLQEEVKHFITALKFNFCSLDAIKICSTHAAESRRTLTGYLCWVNFLLPVSVTLALTIASK